MKASQKARDLVELAVNEETPDKERLVAAMAACKLIKKYGLLDSPIDGLLGGVDNESIQAASTILNIFTDPALTSSIKKIASQFKKKRGRK